MFLSFFWNTWWSDIFDPTSVIKRISSKHVGVFLVTYQTFSLNWKIDSSLLQGKSNSYSFQTVALVNRNLTAVYDDNLRVDFGNDGQTVWSVFFLEIFLIVQQVLNRFWWATVVFLFSELAVGNDASNVFRGMNRISQVFLLFINSILIDV